MTTSLRSGAVPIAAALSVAIVSGAAQAEEPSPLLKACAAAYVATQQLDKNTRFLTATQSSLYRQSSIARQISTSPAADELTREFAAKVAESQFEEAEGMQVVIDDNLRLIKVAQDQMADCP